MSCLQVLWVPENSRILLVHWLKQQDQLASQQMGNLSPSSHLANSDMSQDAVGRSMHRPVNIQQQYREHTSNPSPSTISIFMKSEGEHLIISIIQGAWIKSILILVLLLIWKKMSSYILYVIWKIQVNGAHNLVWQFYS